MGRGPQERDLGFMFFSAQPIRKTIAAMAFFAAAAAAQTLDFDAPLYTGDKTIVDVDGWTRFNKDTVLADNFKIQSGPGGQWLRCLTNTTGTVYRDFPASSGRVDIRWRWRGTANTVQLCFGVARVLPLANGFDPRALTCMDPGGTLEASGGVILVIKDKWTLQNWVYMRLALDNAHNTFSIYVAADSLRADEHVSIADIPMNDVSSPLTRLVLRDLRGTGAVDIDDISWERPATWIGSEKDSAWSTASNWSTGAVPDSLTPVIFDGTSAIGCLLDAREVVKSVTVASDYKGILDLGTFNLEILGSADFTGASAYRSAGGLLRFVSPRGQIHRGTGRRRPYPRPGPP